MRGKHESTRKKRKSNSTSKNDTSRKVAIENVTKAGVCNF
jgi:hypothetical protein